MTRCLPSHNPLTPLPPSHTLSHPLTPLPPLPYHLPMVAIASRRYKNACVGVARSNGDMTAQCLKDYGERCVCVCVWRSIVVLPYARLCISFVLLYLASLLMGALHAPLLPYSSLIFQASSPLRTSRAALAVTTIGHGRNRVAHPCSLVMGLLAPLAVLTILYTHHLTSASAPLVLLAGVASSVPEAAISCRCNARTSQSKCCLTFKTTMSTAQPSCIACRGRAPLALTNYTAIPLRATCTASLPSPPCDSHTLAALSRPAHCCLCL